MIGKKERTNVIGTGAINVLGEGTVITGDLTSNGDLRIDGEVHGIPNHKGRVGLVRRSFVTYTGIPPLGGFRQKFLHVQLSRGFVNCLLFA